MILKGHRSIVNQVRYSAVNHFVVTSGVEKVIKVGTQTFWLILREIDLRVRTVGG